MQRGSEPGLMIVGYRSYKVLLQALTQLAPDVFYMPSLVDGAAG